ncbi:MAG: hypothetical protein M3444_07905, partial [Acidobacteriota bacterium]|nr:hypothetical protein [Acidobacteriota bacterium]
VAAFATAVGVVVLVVQLGITRRQERTAFEDALAREYRAAYAERFDARLRLCSALRRAAFAPPQLAEVAVVALGASERLRRGLARATRRRALPGW